MNIEFNFFFQYLEKEQIFIEKKEFLFQIKSHPDYPSLLSISDTLSFFNIENGALKVLKTEIDFLPDSFIALLKNGNEDTFLYFVERNGKDFILSDDTKRKTVTKTDLEDEWCDVILLIEKNSDIVSNRKKPVSIIFLSIWICFTLTLVNLFQDNFTLISFSFFPLIGIILSLIALKDLFGLQNKLINSICEISSSTNCSNVIKSKKWKVFEYINFSDLSIIFFVFQLISYLLFSINGNLNFFLFAQKILLIISLPVVLISIYFQKYVEKKWCPICILIILVILLELSFLLLINLGNNFIFSLKRTLLLFYIFITISLLWFVLKRILLKINESKEFQIKANRFMRDYDSFKKILTNDKRIVFPLYSAVLGNLNAKTEITIITNPFCGYCKDAHSLISKFLLLDNNNIKVKIVMNVDLENENEENTLFLRVLINVLFKVGHEEFNIALKNWFEFGNIDYWYEKYNSLENVMKIDEFYNKQYQWCRNNNYYSTPLIFINGYKYPKVYERNQLEFFINDIIEDDF